MRGRHILSHTLSHTTHTQMLTSCKRVCFIFRIDTEVVWVCDVVRESRVSHPHCCIWFTYNRDRQTDRETETERDTDRDREREKEIKTDR